MRTQLAQGLDSIENGMYIRTEIRHENHKFLLYFLVEDKSEAKLAM
jgi:hypothetical protein